MTTDYIVSWEIPITADGPADAVLQAWGIVSDPDNEATYFRATDAAGESWLFDAVEIQDCKECLAAHDEDHGPMCSLFDSAAYSGGED